ncbi:MAG: SDR family oxidoreductase [Dehalococcoidales bacterium]|nr:SDR family oxidoreductase [Dehalococcoidales bacterium]
MDTILDVIPLSMAKTPLQKDSMKGEVAVVTGGGSNIGLGISRSLAWLGVKVVIADINPETGYAAEKYINEENGPDSVLFVETDVSDEISMRNLAEKAFRKWDKVDILVNNAMDMRLGAQILKSSVYQLDRQYAISARGTFLGIQMFVPGMQRRKHGVVTYMSTAFRYPVGPSNYCAAKAASTSIMMSLANELGPAEETGISVFTFIPAGIGRPRPEPPPDMKPTFDLHFEMPGYGTFIPPEDCGAAMSYAISRAPEIHNSGVMIQQVFRQMDWPYPKPETVPAADFERINEMALSVIFGYMGPGFPDPKVPLRSINYSDNVEFPIK